MDLNSRAEESVHVVRAKVSDQSRYRLEDEELTEAEEIGTDEYPAFGWFLDVVAVGLDGSELGPRWLECPAGLADALTTAGIEAGDVFRVTEIDKTEDGAFRFEVATAAELDD